ncbi:hypothetical protein [Mucilaginibacter pedocola]|uniref:Uncharacterized protein n=1 Tax=Mucilaginibacter pedocola TaxID=1792845 RepID=A0A1S9PIM4_9SPHI|nr:hypothetical protein [Mucilaginibacter pedocola]OOQ60811.1 hypothetical protein BC343_22835 [Mucilaginibacter pedocola]
MIYISKGNKKILVVVALCLFAVANIGYVAVKGILVQRGIAVTAVVLFTAAFVIGLCTVLFSWPEDITSFRYRVLRPWLFVTIATIISFVVIYLGIVAVIFFPTLIFLGSMGGLMGGRFKLKLKN